MTGPAYDVDLLVAGGGPAGLATALHASRAGLSALVCEPRGAPVDKACGEGLMPQGVRQLAELGVEPAGYELTGIEYADLAGNRAHARFRSGTGRGVRRTELHTALAEAVEAAGVPWVRRRVDRVEQDARSVRAAGVRARWLVAADGLHSPVRRTLGVGVRYGAPCRFGLRRHWRTTPWSTRVEVVWAPHAEAYVTPVGPQLVGVAVLFARDRARTGGAPSYAELLRAFPELAARLDGVEPASPVRGAGPMRQYPRLRVHGRVLLVGDAAGYEDALTGEGVSLALAQARAVVEALADGGPERYERSWRRATRGYRLTTRALVLATSRPLLRRHLLRCCTGAPALFDAAVGRLAR